MIRCTILLAAIVLAGVQVPVQDAMTLRVYFVGNSVTDTINYRALAELAKSRGHQQVWGRHMIPGAPLHWIWEHPKDGFQEPPFGHYPTALAEHQWDVLSLQPVGIRGRGSSWAKSTPCCRNGETRKSTP
jgi:hypothetical protein